METRQIEFEKLRYAYIVVKKFLETEGYEKVTSLKNRVEDDLGLSGDDNYELLEKFVTQFELDNKNFVYRNHFIEEGELFLGEQSLLSLLTLSVWLPLKTIELLTFNKIKIDKPNFEIQYREVTDLTFKDLLTWYIEKEFKLSADIKYEIIKSEL